MIKKVILRNFESHENTEIEFTNGLNLVIGQSNQGKSSIVRAIAMVVANRFDKDCVRTGCDFCSVTLETDRGCVTAERGEDINRWTVQKKGDKPKFYKNIGTGTPPEALEILGMGERVHGDMRELPNIMFQLEKHYMLSEIDGKKATANQIARMMDDAIGIGGMEELIKDMAMDLLEVKKSINSTSSEISELKSRILDESIYSDYSSMVDGMKGCMKRAADYEELLGDAAELSTRQAQASSKLAAIDGELDMLNAAIAQYDRVHILYIRHGMLCRISCTMEAIRKIDDRMLATSEVLSRNDRVEALLSRYVRAVRIRSIMSQLKCIEQRSVDLSGFNIESLCSMHARIEAARETLEHARDVYRKMRKLEQCFMKNSGLLSECEQRLDELKNTLGVCPLCGKEF